MTSEKITLSVSPELYRLLEIEAERRDIGIGTLCRHLVTKSVKHSFSGNLTVKDILSRLGEEWEE